MDWAHTFESFVVSTQGGSTVMTKLLVDTEQAMKVVERKDLGPLEVLKEETLVGEVDVEKCEKTLFPAGPKRYIHVNPLAIRACCGDQAQHPCVVVCDEDGEEHHFHACLMGSGIVRFRNGSGGEGFDVARAHVFFVTTDEIVGLRDLSASQEIFLRRGC